MPAQHLPNVGECKAGCQSGETENNETLFSFTPTLSRLTIYHLYRYTIQYPIETLSREYFNTWNIYFGLNQANNEHCLEKTFNEVLGQGHQSDK